MRNEDMECNAYNAAFCELELQWHWNAQTYEQLRHHGDDGATRVRHYIETQHPHLLKAYDVAFLVAAIERHKANIASMP